MSCINPPPDALFLDAGCGTGDQSIRIARRGYQCIGVDISESILAKADHNVSDCDLQTKVTLYCESLETLPFGDNTFDVVHCRGVLIHIPDWNKALYHLCRVLKPGGKMVIMESNHRSFETFLVLVFRRIMQRNSEMIKTPGGIEFWLEKDGNPFLVRIASLNHLIHQLKKYKVDIIQRFATEFYDINRFPSGILRNTANRFNLFWFSFGLSASLSMGNGIVGEKKLV